MDKLPQKVLHFALSFFLICTSLFLLAALPSVKSLVHSQAEIAKNQSEVLENISQGYEVAYHALLSFTARTLEEERLLDPSDADEIFDESLNKIAEMNPQFAKLTRGIYDNYGGVYDRYRP